MASGNSAVIGLLRVLLSANTAEYESAMKRSADSAKAWTKELRAVGQQATQVGQALMKTLTLPIAGVGVAATKLAIDFESSFAGVRKTVNATEPELAGLAQGFRNLSKTIPVNVNELNKIGEAAGALGIRKDDILEFTKVMAMLGVTTNLTADEAATSIAQIQNIFNAAGKDTANFGSALVALGNDGASSESQIVDFAKRLAGAGHQIGLSQQSVLGFSAALANMGINAELGGTNFSKVMSKMSVAVDTGGPKLKAFADVAGMSGAAFRDLFKSNPTEALLRFTEGLGKAGTSGQNMTTILNDLGLKGSGVQDVMKRLAGGAGQMRTAVDLAAKSWQENTALTKEAQERFKTTESQMKLLWNRVGDVGIALGNALGPAINLTIRGLNALIPVLEQMVGVFNALPASVQLGIIGFAGLVAAAGPAIYVFGQLALATSAVTAAFTAKGLASRLLLADLGFLGTALRANIVAAMATVTSYGAMGAASITMTTAARALGTAILALPWAAATAGAAALAAGLVYLYARAKDAALAAETQGAKQDAINRALEHGAAANAEYAAATDKYAAAVKFNTEWEEKRINAYNRAHRGANSLTDAQQQLNAANAKYNQELKGIEGALAFQIRHMAETGKTAKDLAAEFHISELTVTRYTTALRDNAGATDENNKGKKKALELTSQQVQAMNLLDQAHAHQTAALNLETAAWERWQQVVSKTLSNLPKGRLTEGATGLDPKSLYTPDSPFTIPVRLDILGPTGLDPSKINMGGIEKTGIGGLVGGSGGGLFSKLFGSTEQFGQQMASTIMGAVQGGGNPVTAAAGMVGSKIGSGIAGLLKSDGTKMFTGALGGIFSATLPVIGSLIGPLAGAIWNKLFGTAGRDAVKDFVAGFGGFDAFHAMLGKELPADAERLWIALTQGVGRNNPAEAKKIIDEITAALARKKEQTVEAAQASAAAAVAQQEELDAISAKYSESISKLDEEYKTLSDSVAKEAEEEFMGLTEIHERERMKQIEAEKAAKKQERDAAIQIKQEEFDALLEAGRIADEELRKIFEKGYRSPVRFDFPDGIPGGGAIPSSALPSGYSSGGAGSFDRTASRTSASSGQPVNVKIPLYLDQFGQAKIAEANAKVYVGG